MNLTRNPILFDPRLSKEKVLNEYTNFCKDTEKCKQLHKKVLNMLEVAIKNNELKNFKHVFTFLNHISESDNYKALTFLFDNTSFFNKNNLIILISKYESFDVLNYLFENFKTVCKLFAITDTTLPSNCDETGHNVIYYAIRSGKIKLLKTLINKWPNNYFKLNKIILDNILSSTYQELKLKNIELSKDMELFVQETLINLRFCFDSQSVAKDNENQSSYRNKLIELLCENIELLSEFEIVDLRFIVTARQIAQNINLLKQLLKCTYLELPWEEIEFYVLNFISVYTHVQEISIYIRGGLDRQRIIMYLKNFSKKLKEVKCQINHLSAIELDTLPKISRDDIVLEIIKTNPQFSNLYNDYHQIRDIHSLDRICHYINLTVNVDHTEKEGQLIITRSLQMIGEYFKNTLESPKLSTFISERFLLSLHENTRNILISFRNSLSHAHSLKRRMDIEKDNDGTFFEMVQKDIGKMGHAVADSLYRCKRKMIYVIFEKILICEDLAEIKSTYRIGRKCDIDDIVKKLTSQITDTEKLQKLVDDLEKQLAGCRLMEFELANINEINQILKRNRNKYHTNKNCSMWDEILLQSAVYLQAILQNENGFTSFKSVARERQQILSLLTAETDSLKKIVELSTMLLHNLNADKQKFNKIQKTIYKIIHIIEPEVNNLEWTSELNKRLVKKSKSSNGEVPNFTELDYKKHLKRKLTDLSDILNAHALKNPFKFASPEQGEKLRVVFETLILDILSILEVNKNCLENNVIILENVSILLGKSLRHHLAHDNLLIDVLQPDLCPALVSNARKLVAENVANGKLKIGKATNMDFSEIERIFRKELNIAANQMKMFSALEKGDLDTVKRTVGAGADLLARNIDLQGALHFAAKSRNVELMEFLVSSGVPANHKNMDGETSLHVASASGSDLVVDYLLKGKHLRVDEVDVYGKTALHHAAENGHLEIVKLLLRFGADTYAVDKSVSTPFLLAVDYNRKDVVEFFLRNGHDVNESNAPSDIIPIYAATELGHIEMVEFLLERGAYTFTHNHEGSTLLHMSADEGHLENVKIFLSRGLDVNEKNNLGVTPLFLAVMKGHREVVSLMLGRSIDPNIFDFNMNTPLHYAADKNLENIARDLLRHGAKVNIACNNGLTPLHVAIQGGHTEMVKLLIESGLNLTNKIFNGCLYLALRIVNYDVVKLLLENGISVKREDKHFKDWRMMLFAAYKANAAIFELLMKKKVDVNVEDCNKCTPLHVAAGNGHATIVRMLLGANVNVDCVDALGLTSLHCAALNGHLDVAELLLEYHAKVNAKTTRNFTPLYCAAQNQHGDVVDLLIKNGADINAKTIIGTTALHIAATCGHIEIVKILIKNNADANVKDRTERTPFICAIENGRKEVVDIFIKNGADINFDGCKPILFAVRSKNHNILNQLLSHKAKIDYVYPENLTLLHVALKYGDENIIQTLIENGMDVNRKTYLNRSELILAIECGNHRVAEVLLRNGADVNCQDATGATSLHVAVELNDHRLVEILLKYNANIFARDSQGRSAFEFAVACNKLQYVEMFMQKYKINLNERGNNFTVLHIATQEGHLNMVKYLVEKGASLHSKNDMNSKPIHIAARDGYKEIVEYFLAQGMSIEEPGIERKPLLQYAVSNGQTEIARYLLARGANVNGKDCNGLTPLHIAAYVDHYDVLRCLLENGAIFDDTSNTHRVTPMAIAMNERIVYLLISVSDLFDAVKADDIAKVRTLIANGAVVNARDKENTTPLHYAASKGFKDMVDLLLKNSADPNLAGKNGLCALHYAAQSSRLEIVKSLLLHGAIYDVLSESGKVPEKVATDKEIKELFRMIGNAFTKVAKKDISLLNNLKNTNDEVKRIITTVVSLKGENLWTRAILKKYPSILELCQVLLNDSTDLMKAEDLHVENKLDEALLLYKKVLKKRSDLLGPNHVVTLDILQSIATIFSKQQNFNESIRIFTQIYEIEASLLGENHEITLKTRSELAYSMYYTGQTNEALAILTEVQAKQKELLNPEHENVIYTEVYLGLILSAMGKYDVALSCNRNFCKKKKKKGGAHTVASLISRNNIAKILAIQGKYDEALKIYQEVYKSWMTDLGPSHKFTLYALKDQAGIYYSQKNYEQALKILEEVYEEQKRTLSRDHEETLMTQIMMIEILLEQKKFIPALKLNNEFLSIGRSALGPTHPSILRSEIIAELILVNYPNVGLLQTRKKEATAAINKGDVRALERSLESEINVDDADDDGITMMHLAANVGNPEVVKLLLKKGASVNQLTRKGNTPLHIAVSRGFEPIAEILMERLTGVNLTLFVNFKVTGSGSAALHVAAKRGPVSMVKLLLRKGAAHNLKNKEGKTPLELSTDDEIVQYLDFVRHSFDDASTGSRDSLNKMKTLSIDELKVIMNVSNDSGHSLLQVAIINKHNSLANDLLTLWQKAR